MTTLQEVPQEFVKINHTLPREVETFFSKTANTIEERNDYIRALRSAGWSLQSIGSAAGITRERVRQIAVIGLSNKTSLPTMVIPNPPVKPIKVRKVRPEPSEAAIKRLLKLQPLVQQVRSNSPRYRKEAEEYSALVYKTVTEEGVSLYNIAKKLQVTHGALRFRLARYGYMPMLNGNSLCYKPILEKNRYKG